MNLHEGDSVTHSSLYKDRRNEVVCRTTLRLVFCMYYISEEFRRLYCCPSKDKWVPSRIFINYWRHQKYTSLSITAVKSFRRSIQGEINPNQPHASRLLLRLTRYECYASMLILRVKTLLYTTHNTKFYYILANGINLQLLINLLLGRAVQSSPPFGLERIKFELFCIYLMSPGWSMTDLRTNISYEQQLTITLN